MSDIARSLQAGLPGLPEGSDSPAPEPIDSRSQAALPDFDLHMLALAKVRGVGTQALRALIDAFAHPAVVWEAEPALITKVLHEARVPAASQIVNTINVERRPLLENAARARDWLGREGVILVSRQQPEFPKRLLSIDGQPLWLFIQGDPSALNTVPLVAIIGTRQASGVGKQTAQQLTRLVAEAGLGVVSGLAEGIDEAAHMTAARLGIRQVAVLGTGIDVLFPAATADLRHTIVARGGAIITEYLPSERWGKVNFIQRNRIQAALAAAVCPVEARAQSGTAHTVRFAKKYGRPLFLAWRGDLMATNEQTCTLVGSDTLRFDLTLPAGRAKLRSFLDTEIVGERDEPPLPPEPKLLFRSILKEVDALRQTWDLSPEQRQELQRLVADHLDHDSGGGENSDGR
ncbi:MAG: DNA-protecting protein DprA [Chloroflexota bacterium]|nr:DNA-protecting protein DprA [Chloroflexota bacterium]